MNLENFNVRELNAEEKQETQGGCIWAIIAIAIIAYNTYQAVRNEIIEQMNL